MSSWTIHGTEPKSQVTCCRLKKTLQYVNNHREQLNLCSSLDNWFGVGCGAPHRSKTQSKYKSIVQSTSPIQNPVHSPESSFYKDSTTTVWITPRTHPLPSYPGYVSAKAKSNQMVAFSPLCHCLLRLAPQRFIQHSTTYEYTQTQLAFCICLPFQLFSSSQTGSTKVRPCSWWAGSGHYLKYQLFNADAEN